MQSMSQSNFKQKEISEVLVKPNLKAFWQSERGFQKCGFCPGIFVPGFYTPIKLTSDRVNKVIISLTFLIWMSGKNKSTLSALWFVKYRKVLSQEKMRNLSIIPGALLSVHLDLHQCQKEAKKEVMQTLHWEIRAMTKGFPFLSWLVPCLNVRPPRIWA